MQRPSHPHPRLSLFLSGELQEKGDTTTLPPKPETNWQKRCQAVWSWRLGEFRLCQVEMPVSRKRHWSPSPAIYSWSSLSTTQQLRWTKWNSHTKKGPNHFRFSRLKFRICVHDDQVTIWRLKKKFCLWNPAELHTTHFNRFSTPLWPAWLAQWLAR